MKWSYAKTVSHAESSSNNASAAFIRLNAFGDPINRALPTPSNAQNVMHGSDTNRNASDNTSSRKVLSPPPTNTLTTATAIIHTLGLITCSPAPAPVRSSTEHRTV